MAACFVSQRVATKSKLMLRAVNVTHAAAARLLSPLAQHMTKYIYAYFISAFFYFHAKKSPSPTAAACFSHRVVF